MTTTTELRTTELTSDPLRRLAAWVAPVGPLAMAGWSLSIPYDLTDAPADYIPKLADETRVELSFWMMLAFVLTIGVGVGVTGLVARRGSPRLGTVGMVLAYLGFSAMGFGGIAYDGIAAASVRAGLDVGTIEDILKQADTFTAPLVGGMIFIPMSFIGTLLLGIALWRGPAMPRWAAALLIVAFPVILAGGAFLMTANAFGFVMIAVAFAVAGREFARPAVPHAG